MARKMTIEMVPALNLVEDFDLYPRVAVNPVNIASLVDVLVAGIDLPPGVADRKSKRIIDGFTRRRSRIKHFGKECKVPMILKDYASEKEMFEDAVNLNISHGLPLSPFEKIKCSVKMKEFGLNLKERASILQMAEATLLELSETRMAKSNGHEIVLKKTLVHLVGTKLTTDQLECNRKAGGRPQIVYVNQIISLIESEAVDWDNENLVKRMQHLYQVLGDQLS